MINSSILLSFGFHVLKRPAEKNSDAYKTMAEENLPVQHLKTSVKKKASLLATLDRICTRKMEWMSNDEEF